MLDYINDYIISMFFRWFSSSLLTVLKAPTVTGITVALIFRNFCTCNLKSWYLVVFSVSFTLVFDLKEHLCCDFAFSLLFINNYNV